MNSQEADPEVGTLEVRTLEDLDEGGTQVQGADPVCRNHNSQEVDSEVGTLEILTRIDVH